MIHPVIFTHKPDSSCVVEAAGAAMEAGLKAPWIFNDSRDPLDDLTVFCLKQMGCTVRNFTRKTTIAGQYGRDCAFGIAEAYNEVLNTTKDDYVIKLDSDTVVLKLDRYNKAVQDEVLAAGWAWEGWVYSGCSCLVSRRGVDRLMEFHLNNEPLPRGLSAEYCPSDVLEYAVLKTLELPRIWPYDEKGGFGAGYLYRNSRVTLAEYARRFDVVTFGQRYLLDGEPQSRREHVARTMSSFRSIYRNMK